MAITYTILYEKHVVSDDIPELPRAVKARIRKAIEDKLVHEPEVFGKPLRNSLRNYRKLRVGDHRVIFRISKKDVLVFCIGHRSRVYQVAEKRT